LAKVLHRTPHIIGQFGDALPNQSLSRLVPRKLKLVQQK